MRTTIFLVALISVPLIAQEHLHDDGLGEYYKWQHHQHMMEHNQERFDAAGREIDYQQRINNERMKRQQEQIRELQRDAYRWKRLEQSSQEKENE